MAIDYVEMQNVARELITENGREITLRRVVDASPIDPDQPWVVAAPVTTDFAVIGCFVAPDERRGSFPTEQRTEAKQVTHIETAFCFLDALSLGGVVPNTKDVVVDGSDTWAVTIVDPMTPGALPVYYILTLEK